MEQPTSSRVSAEWQRVADRARAQPGVWMLAKRDVWKAVAHQINTGKIVAFAGGGFRAVTRRRSDRGDKRLCDVWVVYTGSEQA